MSSLQKTLLAFILSFTTIAIITNAITWPTTPAGEVEGGKYMNIINRILVNTGTNSSGTVKQAQSIGLEGQSPVLTVSGGNVGIGISPSTSTNTKLSVGGGIVNKVQDGFGTFAAYTYSDNPSYVSAIIGLRARGTITNPTYVLNGDYLLSVGGRDLIDNKSGAGFNIRAGGDFSTTSKPTYIDFFTTGSGEINPLVRQTIKEDGKVGIGTTAPISKFEVKTTVLDQLRLSGNSQFISLGVNTSTGTWNPLTKNGDVNIIYGGITGANTDNGLTIAPWSNSSEGIRIDNVGNIGIGTTSPNKLLHLKTPTGTNAELDIQSGTKPHWGIYHDETTEQLRFWNGSDKISFSSGGNVGIGITNPESKLVINTGISNYLNSDLEGLIVKSDSYTDAGGNITNQGTAIQSGRSGIGFNRIRKNGNFSIGKGFSSLIQQNISGTLDFITWGNATINNQNIDIVGGRTAMSILNSNGNVGIGTTNPQAKLDVNGRILITGNNPCTTWADCDLVIGHSDINRHDTSLSMMSTASAIKMKLTGNTLNCTN